MQVIHEMTAAQRRAVIDDLRTMERGQEAARRVARYVDALADALGLDGGVDITMDGRALVRPEPPSHEHENGRPVPDREEAADAATE